MPGRAFLTRPARDIAAALDLQDWPADVPRRNIAPGQEVSALLPDGPRRMRWGLIPQGRTNARGRPVMETIVNARSETVLDKSAFAGVGFAVMPVDGWYEWTGPARRKTAHRIVRRDGALILFAAIFDIWTAPGGLQIGQLATVTCEPNADVRDIHHRMGVILAPDDIGGWLAGDDDSRRALMRPAPDGALVAEADPPVDWSAA